jgi:short-subunit dehydrogenase
MSQFRALVTGATKGMGRSISEALAGAGFDVGLLARNRSDLVRFQEKLLQQYPNRTFPFYPVDLGSSAEREKAIAELDTISWDLLVNNAGLYKPAALLDAADDLADMWAVNVAGPYDLMRGIVPGMIERGSGHVINICSVASVHPQAGSAAYSATKSALLSLTRSLRSETKDHGISVTAIMPGQTWSNTWQGVDLPGDRLMQPGDIGQIVLKAWELAPSAVVEEITLRPQQGDL